MVAAAEEHPCTRDVVLGGDDDDPLPAVVLREPRDRLGLAARAVRNGLEADDLEAQRPVLPVAEPVRLRPLLVPERAGDREDGRHSALDELQRRVEPPVPSAGQDDHRVGVSGRAGVRLGPDEQERDRDEPEPDEHEDGDEEAAHR